MRILFIFFICLATSFSLFSASVKGIVVSKGKPLEFAKVYLKGANLGAITSISGYFEIKGIPEGSHWFFASLQGYQSDSVLISLQANQTRSLQFVLKPIDLNLDEVVVTGTLKETYLSDSPVAIDIITPKLFQKNPTPNIYEALNMVNGVRPQMQCNVCNTGDIHINGMEGPYTMVMIDGMPIVSALGTVYGLMGIPNSIIQRVEIQKGPASTLYGSEAIGGLINVITKSPSNAPLLSFDFFGTSYQEFNADLGVKYRLGKRVSGLLSSNIYHFDKRWDYNKDNFTDVTLQKRMAFFNKLGFEHRSGKSSHLALRYYYEDRWGGEMNWDKKFRGGDSIYGESIYTNRFEIIGLSPLAKGTNLQYSFNYHDQNSAYGNTPFLATQLIGFAQVTKNIQRENHDWMLGLASRYIHYDDNTCVTEKLEEDSCVRNMPTVTILPGIFIQDEIRLGAKHTLLAGLRYDYNSNHGHILSPRINWKWAMNEFHTLRLGIGNGYRVVNLFSEDHAAFNGARDVVIVDELKPEQSWSANLNHSAFFGFDKAYLTLETNLFYTYFSNKIVADYFTDHTKVIFDNLHGYGINRGGGVQMHLNFNFPLKIGAGFTYTDIYLREKDSLGLMTRSRQVQTPPFTAIYSMSYTLKKIRLRVDLTGNVYSPMLLPVLPNDYRPDHSPWFTLLNIQLTKELGKNWELYAGVKNLLNFLPKEDPIMRPHDPFDKYAADPVSNPNAYTFDPGYNYAPLQGIRFFGGVRINL